MISLRLDLNLYPRQVIERGIDAYQGIAHISIKSVGDDSALLELVGRGRRDETLVEDEFLNYLLALRIKSQAEL